MPAGILTPYPRLRELSDLGVVLPGAKLHTYVAGTPATNLATYSNVGLTVPNLNPLIASAGGLFGPIFLTPGLSYKFVLTDASDATIWTQDDIRADVVPTVSEVNLILSDVVTDDVSIARHGFAPKAPNDVTKFLNGLGAYSVPPAAVIPAGAFLLHQGTVTDASAGATTVDPFAITGLTAKDRLWITYTMESLVQATAGPITVYSSTDSVALTTLFSASAGIGAGSIRVGSALINPAISDLHKVLAVNTNTISGGAMENFTSALATLTTLWTANFSIGIRHNGVTAGGTFSLTWSVYKLAGQ